MSVPSRRLIASILIFSGAAGGALLGCGDNGVTTIPNLRFGQIGEVRVTVVEPLFYGEGVGELQQVLTWGSTGAWQLLERISYRGLPAGDENLLRNEGKPGTYASFYATLITQLNDSPGLQLFIPELSQELDPDCARGETRVTVRIWDLVKEESASWTRCATGSLGRLSVSSAGPDGAAGRVIQAAALVAEYTQGPNFQPSYLGSAPFGTLDRSEDSGAGLVRPRYFLSNPEGSDDAPADWLPFWQAHKASPSAVPPEVDWSSEMVLVAAVGPRTEAGDSVEIRRILPTGTGTQVKLFERVPGDFCSPAARNHSPIHIIVAPRTQIPILFGEVKVERVSCGI